VIRAKITAEGGFNCRPPDAIKVQNIPQGEIVEGQIAEWALRAKAARRMMAPKLETKVVEAPEKKRTKRKKKDD
jgi:hypothetical protein